MRPLHGLGCLRSPAWRADDRSRAGRYSSRRNLRKGDRPGIRGPRTATAPRDDPGGCALSRSVCFDCACTTRSYMPSGTSGRSTGEPVPSPSEKETPLVISFSCRPGRREGPMRHRSVTELERRSCGAAASRARLAGSMSAQAFSVDGNLRTAPRISRLRQGSSSSCVLHSPTSKRLRFSRRCDRTQAQQCRSHHSRRTDVQRGI